MILKTYRASGRYLEPQLIQTKIGGIHLKAKIIFNNASGIRPLHRQQKKLRATGVTQFYYIS